MASKQPEVDVKAVIEFLAKNLPTTKVMQHDRLVGCFTGSKMVSFLVKSQHKSLKAVTTKEQAEAVAEQVAEYTDPVCMYRVHVSPVRGRLHATPLDKSGFSTDKAAMYAWSYAGSQTFNHVLLALLLVAVIIICLFPVWPRWGKLGALIVCASLLIFLLVFIFGRLLLWWTTWMLGYEVWILPNVFDEAESYSALFRPWISANKVDSSLLLYRLASVAVVAGVAYLIYTRPTEFDRFISTQTEFVAGLYNGAFLADVSEQERQNMDAPQRDTMESLFDDLMGKPEPQAAPTPATEAGGAEDDMYDFEAGLDAFMEEEEEVAA